MVEKAGGIPVILPYGFDSVHLLHGLLLTGGRDLSPKISGCEDSPLVTDPSPERDTFESYMFKKARQADLPILGICRGHQLINCLLGGTLIADLSDAGYKEQHKGGTNLRYHPITTVEGTLLHQLIGHYKEVCTSHHQAIKTLGAGLTASAFSPEGIIEGIEHESGRILGVQNHPERIPMIEPFEWLIKLAAEGLHPLSINT